MARVARAVLDRGHDVRRINLSPGDRLFWRLPGAVDYTGSVPDWPLYVEGFMTSEGVTDLALLGDARIYQAAAIAAAQRLGVRVHVIEHGYLRPDWLTVERDGMSSFSHFPRDPAAIRALAAGRPDPDLAPLAQASFTRYALWDLAYNLTNVFAGPLSHRHYQGHQSVHPLVEYGGWIRKFALERSEARHRDAVLATLAADPRPTFLMPLQLATDFQLRTHSFFPHLYDAVAWILRSFTRNADPAARLLFKVHPLDNSLARWRSRIARMAAGEGIGSRVFVIDGGDLDAILAASAGVVTVNSTVGIAAIRAGRPLIALGNAVFDVPGLADQRPLAEFWRDPRPPDPELARDFLRALAWSTQVRGGFTAEQAMELGASNVAERILEPGDRLPRIAPQDRSAVAFRRREEWLRTKE
jgi:capsular polysaccharide export protein